MCVGNQIPTGGGHLIKHTTTMPHTQCCHPNTNIFFKWHYEN